MTDQTPPANPLARSFSLIQEAPFSGAIEYCETCFPLLQRSPVCLGPYHYRRDFPGGQDLDVYDDQTKLTAVEEVFQHPRYPGLLIREYVMNGDRFVLCRNHGMATIMRRLRFIPKGRIVDATD